jgi:hypothetical protein
VTIGTTVLLSSIQGISPHLLKDISSTSIIRVDMAVIKLYLLKKMIYRNCYKQTGSFRICRDHVRIFKCRRTNCVAQDYASYSKNHWKQEAREWTAVSK